MYMYVPTFQSYMYLQCFVHPVWCPDQSLQCTIDSKKPSQCQLQLICTLCSTKVSLRVTCSTLSNNGWQLYMHYSNESVHRAMLCNAVHKVGQWLGLVCTRKEWTTTATSRFKVKHAQITFFPTTLQPSNVKRYNIDQHN